MNLFDLSDELTGNLVFAAILGSALFATFFSIFAYISFRGWTRALIGWRKACDGWDQSRADHRRAIVGWQKALAGWETAEAKFISQEQQVAREE